MLLLTPVIVLQTLSLVLLLFLRILLNPKDNFSLEDLSSSSLTSSPPLRPCGSQGLCPRQETKDPVSEPHGVAVVPYSLLVRMSVGPLGIGSLFGPVSYREDGSPPCLRLFS